jgi:hypothetical protein
METIPFTIDSKKNQIPTIKYIKGSKWSLKEEKQTPVERNRGRLQKVERSPTSWIGGINIIKMSILPKAIYLFNVIPIKIPMTFITEIEKSILKFIWKQETVNSQGNTLQKLQYWKYHNTWPQTILQSNRNKNSMVLAKKQTWRPVEQNRGPDMNSYNYTQLIFDKDAKNIQWRKDSLFKKCWENGFLSARNWS